MFKKAIVTLALTAAPLMANAADMAVKAPIRAVFPPTWTGCFVGGNIGGGWQNTHTVYWEYQGKIQNQDGGSHSGSGVVGGGQVGCDYQMGTWVLGLHGMFDWANMKGSNIYPGNSPETLTTKAKWFGTLTGRFGYTVESNTLAYVKGGAAWIRNDYQDVYASAYDGRASETLSGWTIGGGLEHMLHHNWSVFAEYNYASFGSHHVLIVDSLGHYDSWINRYKHDLQTLLVGLNYRFK